MRPEGEHLADDRILDLVLGLLASEASRADRAHLASYFGCAERLRQAAASHARAASRAATVAGASAPRRAVVRPPRAARGRWLAVAAAFVAIVGAFVMLRQPANPIGWPGAAPALPPPVVVGLTRDDGTATDSLVLLGLEAYSRGDFEAARRALAAARSRGAVEQARLVHLGAALLHTNRPAEALVVLRAVDPAQVAEPWRSEARWMLAQSLERTGRRASADSLLRALARTPNAVGGRARRALDER